MEEHVENPHSVLTVFRMEGREEERVNVDDAPVYKAHRIHATSRNGLWVSMIVGIGTRKPMTKDSLTDTVTRVPEEYYSREEAMQAAKRYIDDEDSRRQEKAGKDHDAPASA